MQQTLVNGNRYSWVSISIRLAGLSFPGGPFRSINYSATKNRPKVFGNGVRPLGRTRGQFECDASFEIYASEFDAMTAEFASQLDLTQQGIMDYEFDIAVSYAENDGDDVRTDELIGISITKVSLDNSQGTEPTIMKCELSLMDLKLNGLSMVGTSGPGITLGVAVGTGE